MQRIGAAGGGESEMHSTKVIVKNQTGIHARPAASLAKLAKNFKCNIILKNGEQSANCASVLSLLTIAATKGCEVEVDYRRRG